MPGKCFAYSGLIICITIGFNYFLNDKRVLFWSWMNCIYSVVTSTSFFRKIVLFSDETKKKPFYFRIEPKIHRKTIRLSLLTHEWNLNEETKKWTQCVIRSMYYRDAYSWKPIEFTFFLTGCLGRCVSWGLEHLHLLQLHFLHHLIKKHLE